MLLPKVVVMVIEGRGGAGLRIRSPKEIKNICYGEVDSIQTTIRILSTNMGTATYSCSSDHLIPAPDTSIHKYALAHTLRLFDRPAQHRPPCTGMRESNQLLIHELTVCH